MKEDMIIYFRRLAENNSEHATTHPSCVRSRLLEFQLKSSHNQSQTKMFLLQTLSLS